MLDVKSNPPHNLLGNLDGKLAHARSAILLDDPVSAARNISLWRVRYPVSKAIGDWVVMRIPVGVGLSGPADDREVHG